MRILNVPSNARYVILQQKPTLRLSFIVPAHTRKVRRYIGDRGTAATRLDDRNFDVPDMVYSLEVNQNRFTMYVLDKIDRTGMWMRVFRLANIHQGGDICWGNNRLENYDPRYLVNEFWGSNFNDDLTPYPQATEQDWLDSQEFKQDAVSRADKERLLQTLRDGAAAYNADYVYVTHKYTSLLNEMNERLAFFDNKMLHLRDNKQVSLRNVEAYLKERELPTQHISSKIASQDRVMYRLQKIYSHRSNLVRTFANDYNRFLVAVQSEIGTVLCLLYDKQGTRDLVIKLLRDMRERYKAIVTRYGLTNRQFRGFCLSEGIQRTIAMKAEANDSRRKFTDRWFREIRERWWGGLWRTHGPMEDYRSFIFGSEHQIIEEGCAGAVQISILDCNSEFFKTPLGNPYRTPANVLIPFFRVPGRDDIVAAVHGDRPFILRKQGSHWTLEHYDERSKAVQEALVEIFG